MGSTFFIENTSGTLSIILSQGQLNGPGGINRDTDLSLYGIGVAAWGEGINTNILRLTESFACPAKSILGGSPTLTNVPQNENDLGPRLGITVPIDGQLWWNTTNQVLYIYDGDAGAWKLTSKIPATSTPPSAPSVGDLWYDIDVTGDVFQGCGEGILKVYDPTHPQRETDDWVRVAAEYLNQCGAGSPQGDYMSGELSMVDPTVPATRYRITNIGDPTNNFDVTNKSYVDNEVLPLIAAGAAALDAHIADDDLHLIPGQNTFLDELESNCMSDGSFLGFDICTLDGYDSGTGIVYDAIDRRITRDASDDMNIGAFLGLGTEATPNTPTLNHHATPKQYVDNEFLDSLLKTVSDNMDVGGFLGLGSSGTPTSPTLNHHATPKSWADSTITTDVAAGFAALGADITSFVTQTPGYVVFSNNFVVQWGISAATSGGPDTYLYNIVLPLVQSSAYTLTCSIYRSSPPNGGDADRIGGAYVFPFIIRMWSKQNTAHSMAWITTGRV